MGDRNEPNHSLPDRRSIRLPDRDYTHPGCYFVTFVAYERQCLFGKIHDGSMDLFPLGRIVMEQWNRLHARFPNWSTDEFGVMPNHAHGILIKKAFPVGRGAASPDRPCASDGSLPGLERSERGRPYLTPPAPDSLGVVIRSFKSAVTFRCHQALIPLGHPVWQRNYYEHIVRGPDDLDRIRRYIRDNPLHWAEDLENIDRG